MAHATVPLTSQFTVVANHLAQHGELSLLAIGLAVHIQSLPDGARVSIRVLAGRFPETEYRIGRALRELEAAGFLRRTRVRLPSGKVITRTVSYNHPQAALGRTPTPEPRPKRDPVPEPVAVAAPGAWPEPVAVAEPEPEPEPERVAVAVAGAGAPEAVRRALAADVPSDLRNPAGLVAHRLKASIPPPLPGRPWVTSYGPLPPDRPQHPFQNCDRCDRAFRAARPGQCGECTAGEREAA